MIFSQSRFAICLRRTRSFVRRQLGTLGPLPSPVKYSLLSSTLSSINTSSGVLVGAVLISARRRRAWSIAESCASCSFIWCVTWLRSIRRRAFSSLSAASLVRRVCTLDAVGISSSVTSLSSAGMRSSGSPCADAKSLRSSSSASSSTSPGSIPTGAERARRKSARSVPSTPREMSVRMRLSWLAVHASAMPPPTRPSLSWSTSRRSFTRGLSRITRRMHPSAQALPRSKLNEPSSVQPLSIRSTTLMSGTGSIFLHRRAADARVATSSALSSAAAEGSCMSPSPSSLALPMTRDTNREDFFTPLALTDAVLSSSPRSE
mmetsp:Transcript_18649/g.60807  ORF Transcript_18649/g.60807 Transcript_18649/m.60807 type:complete len:319 (+) Transcript_18649:1120-2076(+)